MAVSLCQIEYATERVKRRGQDGEDHDSNLNSFLSSMRSRLLVLSSDGSAVIVIIDDASRLSVGLWSISADFTVELLHGELGGAGAGAGTGESFISTKVVKSVGRRF